MRGPSLHSSLAVLWGSLAGVGTISGIGWILEGCPGVKGPIPQPVLMSALTVTNRSGAVNPPCCGAKAKGSACLPSPGQGLEQRGLKGGDPGIRDRRLGVCGRQGSFGIKHLQEAVGTRIETKAGQPRSHGGLIAGGLQSPLSVQLIGIVSQGGLDLLKGHEDGLVKGRQGRLGEGVRALDTGLADARIGSRPTDQRPKAEAEIVALAEVGDIEREVR